MNSMKKALLISFVLCSALSSFSYANNQGGLEVKIFAKESLYDDLPDEKVPQQQAHSKTAQEKSSSYTFLAFPEVRLSGLNGVLHTPSLQTDHSVERYDMFLNLVLSSTQESYTENDGVIFLDTDGHYQKASLSVKFGVYENTLLQVKIHSGVHTGYHGLHSNYLGTRTQFFKSQDLGYHLGDTEVSVSHQWSSHGYTLIPFISAKFATGSQEDLLSTGNHDYAVGVDFPYALQDNWTIQGQFSYKVLGDYDFDQSGVNNLNLEESAQLSLGLHKKIDDTFFDSFTVTGFISQNPYRNASNLSVLKEEIVSLSFSLLLREKMMTRTQIECGLGLSDASPDFSLGLSFHF